MQRKKNVLVIASDYYKEISDNLLKETITELSDNNLQYTVEIVTGVFEIPSIIEDVICPEPKKPIFIINAE